MRGALHHRARAQPDTLAFSVGGATTTFGALAGDAARLASALRAAGVAPGDHLAILLPSSLDFRALRFASNGGEGVHIDTIRRFEDRFRVPGTVRPGYGLTETTLTVSTLTPGLPLRALPGGIPSCGPALPGTEIGIVDEEGAPLPAGEAGEITVRGPSVFAGYYKDPEGTGRVLRDGWVWTGDQGVMDGDGHLYVTGRQRWMIKRAGATIVPGEAEEAAGRVQGVGRAAALGVPDPRGSTDRFVVILEVDEAMVGAGRDTLRRLAGEVASAMARGVGHQPGEIVMVGAGVLPRTGSGKLRHGELRDIVSRGEVNARLHPIATFS
ncbi:MAG TPA: class I adenylate-forming enzyme family protein [Vicinamibacterales bacterium]|nr:class I adenylate-forming enzyme family protein [Vicinamibacterales bacterium]